MCGMPLAPEKHPLVFIVFVVIALLVFYTGYDKQSKSLAPEKLVQVLSFSDVSQSLREFNKTTSMPFNIRLVHAWMWPKRP